MEQGAGELEQALAELERTRAELLALFEGMDDAALSRKGVVGAWSIKNVLAHLAAWEEWVAGALPRRVATGTTPAEFAERAENEDRFNDVEVAERERLTGAEQIAELTRIRAELVAYLRGLDAATVARTHPWDSWPGTIPAYVLQSLREHEVEHIAALQAAGVAARSSDV